MRETACLNATALFRKVAESWDLPSGVARRLVRAGLVSVDGVVVRDEGLLVAAGASIKRLDLSGPAAPPKTWRDKQAAQPDPVQAALEAWNERAGDDYPRMFGALEAAERAEALARQCDEPGCEREADCGFAVDGGYRRTCYEHGKWGGL